MLRAQCRLFVIGSSLFAIGTVPGLAMLCYPDATSLLCFMGSWFFTSAALIQLLLSRPSMSRSWGMPSIRAECLSAAIQLFGTLNFNLSTGATLWAERVPPAGILCGGPTPRVRWLSGQRGSGGCGGNPHGRARSSEITIVAGSVDQHDRFDRFRRLCNRRLHYEDRNYGRRTASSTWDLRRGTVFPDRRSPQAAQTFLTSTRPDMNSPLQRLAQAF